MFKKYLETQLTIYGEPYQGIKKLRGEASNRNFYRVYHGSYSSVAMVYPAPAAEEIQRICRLTDVYRRQGLNVPQIRAVLGDRVILQEDLGDTLVQKTFSQASPGEKDRLLHRVADILAALKTIDRDHTGAVLDAARMKWEMDFFITHFAPHFLTAPTGPLQEHVHAVVDAMAPIDTFAHRDFHSRNMLWYKNGIYLVDYQDSLVGPAYYDLVSFAFDAYLDLKHRRALLLKLVRQRGIMVDEELYYLAALQRNIKALGTFGFQVTVKKNLAYKKYIKRTVRHIENNPFFGRFFQPGQFAGDRLLPGER